MAPSQWERAESDRSSLEDHLDLLEQELNDHKTTALTRTQVENYLEEAAESKTQLIENHKVIRSVAPKGTDMGPLIQAFHRLSKKASRIHSGFHGILMSMPAPATASSSTPRTTATPHQSIKLPPLELPKFSGNLQEWVSFRDMFTTAVHNSSYTKVEKLTQLKALLTGEAARQVRSLILSEANYDIAWKSLQDRYENNRELLFSILKRLLNQPVISSSNATTLRSLIDTTKECIRSLEVLSIPTQHWDAIILFVLFSKLDASSRELWEQSLPDTSIPTLTRMYEFLEQRARALAASSVPASRPQAKTQQQHVRAHHVTTTTCKFGCDSIHPYFKCPTLKQQSPQQRLDTAKRLHLCVNCLNNGHIASSCPSHHSCKVCSRKHHTMLHLENQQQTQGQQNTTAAVTSHHIQQHGELHTGIIATARISINSTSKENTVRTMVDPGSSNSGITLAAAKRLNLKLRKVNIPMSGLQDAHLGTARYVTSFSFKPHFNSMNSFSVTAIVVKSINSCLPTTKMENESWTHLDGLELADPDYDKPAPVDVLLGTEVFWSLLENEVIKGESAAQPVAVKTSLGWLVAGKNTNSSPITMFNINFKLDQELRRFFDQESMEETPVMSTEETSCENHFAATHQRDSTGRFTVTLPLKEQDITNSLGSSYQAAVKRFLSLENKFVHQRGVKDAEVARKLTNQWSEYIRFMREYIDLGHMQRVPANEIVTEEPTYYIPHHSVIKESSTTTKLRVVFDASAATSSGVSLNDCMMVGPQLQDDIRDIMLRFRIWPIVFTADIEKMYRQIWVNKKQINLQRIIWRDHPSLPLVIYYLLSVTYGTSSAPYLAVKCLQQLAEDERERFPLAAMVALRDFFVDDTASGCDTLDTAKKTVQQLMDLCKSGGFILRKWTTNNQDLLNCIPEDLRETRSLIQLQDDCTIKTLGVYWNPAEDKYSFRLSLPPDMSGNYTKRLILSEFAKIYDPLGWLSPAIIVCKIYMQELWKTKHDWDDILPASLQDQWLSIKSSLQDLEQIQIPRCVKPISNARVQLIGCSDASTKALSAAVYFCCEASDGSTSCHLLTSKTKVAPVKLVTLPRLELNAAVLLSELLKSTLKALKLNNISVRAFTDSTITLHWIRSNPAKWKLYIRRRVQAIQDNIPSADWYHIAGDRNPADCASRGISALDLLNHPLWWNGTPEFFTSPHSSNDLLDEDVTQMEAEVQRVKIHHIQPQYYSSFLFKYSRFWKLQRVTAYILRFLNNWMRPRRQTPLQMGPLTVSEIQTSRNFILRLVQQSSFIQEYETLAKGATLPSSSSLLKLQPFIASDGLLRVGGRLRHSTLPFARKHPILLPRGNHITTCIITDTHHQLFHGGATVTLATLQQQYWITNGRDIVRMVLRRCVICARHRADLMKQVMGDLPSDRVNPSPPFTKVGVDYAGPIAIRPMVRSKVSLKCWLAVFVCFATRAIHIEVVSSLTTECFLAALRRFISRRGKPSDIYSDCGTNFKESDKTLRDFYLLCNQSPVQEECSKQLIHWHFNPAGAPHFGGLWEAGVKSIKHHLKRVMGSSLLTYEEMLTLVVQIEGILNSRPLIPASADPSDLGVLTPAHFLIGTSITAVPEPCLLEYKENHLKRWQLLQRQQQQFWKRWSNEYLTRLQQRPKWLKPSPELQIGQLVIIKDERLPPLKWKMGRVLAVHPGADGHVRVATLKTSDGELRRPIVKLTILPVN